MECNLNFDCSSIGQFKKLQIMSDCDKPDNETHCESFPTNYPPTEVVILKNKLSILKAIFFLFKECDAGCQTKRYYEKLHQYILKLWRALVKKYKKLRNVID